jgi:hypothetical protein
MLAYWIGFLASMGWAKPRWIQGQLLLLFLGTLIFSLKTGKCRPLELCDSVWKLIWSERSPLERFCVVLMSILLLIRLWRCVTPVMNWDSFNYHLPLLWERTQAGNLELLRGMSVDYRTMWGGVLLKWPAAVMDPFGRVLVMYHFLLGVISLCCIASHVAKRCSVLVSLVAVASFFALSDLWVYVMMAGDEPWFLCFGALWMIWFLRREELELSRTEEVTMMFCILGMISIKMTAVFLLVPMGISVLWDYVHRPKILILGVVLSVCLFAPLLAHKHQQVGFTYPIKRWVNLLSFDDELPRLMNSKYIAQARRSLGLMDHRDNKDAGDGALGNLVENASRVGSWPIGPQVIWLMLFMCFYPSRLGSLGRQRMGTLLCLSFLAILVAACLWSFSPQARCRYLLPVWMWIAVGVVLVISRVVEVDLGSSVVRKGMRAMVYSVIFMLMFATLMEGKLLKDRLSLQSIWEPRLHWLKALPDGSLIGTWEHLKDENERAFYMGSSSILMAGKGHILAQAGNEVGWRSPEDLPNYLKSNNVVWWILARSAERVDGIYRALTKRALTEGWLVLEHQGQAGEIYRVELGDDVL